MISKLKDLMTHHKVIFGNCRSMREIPDSSVQLMVTSPPYFNAPFDYKDLFPDYNTYLQTLLDFATETYRVLAPGRIAVVNIDDMLVDGKKYPIVADATRLFMMAGFTYRDRIVWKKPDGYLRISRRSGVLLQNPYPMYYYPDNLLEGILIFQKGKFDYRSISKQIRDESKVDTKRFQDDKWFMTLWEMTNVLPGSVLEKDIAAYPDELPRRIITLFSYKYETVLDPFLGSGTTMKVARELGRNSIGIELNSNLLKVIKTKSGFSNDNQRLFSNDDSFEVVMREDENVGYRS